MSDPAASNGIRSAVVAPNSPPGDSVRGSHHRSTDTRNRIEAENWPRITQPDAPTRIA